MLLLISLAIIVIGMYRNIYITNRLLKQISLQQSQIYELANDVIKLQHNMFQVSKQLKTIAGIFVAHENIDDLLDVEIIE